MNLTERLQTHTIIGLDTSVFIYHFAAHPRFLPLTRVIHSGVSEGAHLGVTSAITFMQGTDDAIIAAHCNTASASAGVSAVREVGTRSLC